MSHSNDDVTPDSTYPALEAPPEFKSQIPEYLLAGASPQDRHIMEALSIGAQYDKWTVRALVEAHAQLRLTNGKVRRNREDIEILKSDRKKLKVGWKVVTAIVGGVAGFVTFAVMVYQAFRGV